MARQTIAIGLLLIGNYPTPKDATDQPVAIKYSVAIILVGIMIVGQGRAAASISEELNQSTDRFVDLDLRFPRCLCDWEGEDFVATVLDDFDLGVVA